MKKYLFLISAAVLLLTTGCSNDDEISDMLRIGRESYPVKNGKFYIDMMPSNTGPAYIFHCGIEGDDFEELVISMRGKAFRVGETYQMDQFNASLIPGGWCATPPAPYYTHVTKGSIKLVGKKKSDDKDVLTFKINGLTFEESCIVNGTVNFEYDGTVY